MVGVHRGSLLPNFESQYYVAIYKGLSVLLTYSYHVDASASTAGIGERIAGSLDRWIVGNSAIKRGFLSGRPLPQENMGADLQSPCLGSVPGDQSHEPDTQGARRVLLRRRYWQQLLRWMRAPVSCQAIDFNCGYRTYLLRSATDEICNLSARIPVAEVWCVGNRLAELKAQKPVEVGPF